MDDKILDAFLKGITTKRSVFVSYHHAHDQECYNSFSKIFGDLYGVVEDNSLNRVVDSDNAEYVMRRIREDYITGTSVTFVLCGYETAWRKYVDWEIKATLDKKHGLIGVCLPSVYHDPNYDIIVPDRLAANIQTGYASWIPWQDLQQGPTFLRSVVQGALDKSSVLIDNSLTLRKRNGSPPSGNVGNF